jgi:hypothetical protein
MHKKLYSWQKSRRTNKESTRFAEAFEAAACRNQKMSLANIVFKMMSGEGCFSFKTDLEFAVDLDAFNNEKPANMADLLLTFGFPKDLENKTRTFEQNAAFAKMLKHVLKHNPDLTIGEIRAYVVMGQSYCSYHKDEDLAERMEAFGS